MAALPPSVAKALEEARKLVDWEGFDRGRVEAAIKEMLAKVDVVYTHYLENCVGCAACAPACPYYPVSEKYGPVEKAEHARHIYRREATLLGRLLGPLLDAKKPKKPEHLDMLVEMVYRCTNCGACYLACPFGIDSGSVIKGLLAGLVSRAGRLPMLMAVFEALERTGAFFEVPALRQIWDDVMKKAAEAIGRELPFDKPGSDYMLFVSMADAMFYPDAVVGAVRILEKSGVDWTLPSQPLGFRPPIAAVVGFSPEAKQVLKALDERISKLQPRSLVLLDGGFVYLWMRWNLPKVLGRRPSYRVLHIVEFAYQMLREGRLKLRQTEDPVTWHDPCQLARRSGVTKEPVEVLKAASRGFRLLPHHGAESLCCGGGGGIGCLSMQMIEQMAKIVGVDPSMLVTGEKERRFIEKTQEAWAIAVKRKIDDIRKSGAKTVVTACPVCMHSIEGGARLYGLDIEVRHIAAYLAERLA